MTGNGERAIPWTIALLGIGLLAAVFAVWTYHEDGQSDRAQIKQLREQGEVARQTRERLQSLVQGLQEQVRDLGGQPLTAPAPPARPAPSGQAEPAPASSRTAATARPSPTAQAPQPSRPPASPKPAPSPSPSGRVCIANVCLPPEDR